MYQRSSWSPDYSHDIFILIFLRTLIPALFFSKKMRITFLPQPTQTCQFCLIVWPGCFLIGCQHTGFHCPAQHFNWRDCVNSCCFCRSVTEYSGNQFQFSPVLIHVCGTRSAQEITNLGFVQEEPSHWVVSGWSANRDNSSNTWALRHQDHSEIVCPPFCRNAASADVKGDSTRNPWKRDRAIMEEWWRISPLMWD